ncbi:MAG: hypothetical protein DI603_07230 [Roseateles depolymerans]|uniref:Uncharacterized protein n=1 Tax=Roseateles depolymerans TaxID=76731 RepID=A0A2W5FS83_9BURK|nr:MAG: hypothetical protein DI603_07230 [Roseateles depolymerans]
MRCPQRWPADMSAALPNTPAVWRDLRVRLPATPYQWLALAAATGAGAAGLMLASHHPLSATGALAAWLLTAVLAALCWVATPALLLAPLPLIGLAPWTGWLTFEEQDLLVTACACGGYLAYALQLHAWDRAPAWRHALKYSAVARTLLVLLALSAALSVGRGMADAGGFSFGWFQGYMEPMNSWRNAKALFWVLLMLPLWQAAAAARPRTFSRSVLLGLVIALAGGSAAALWERVAYTALLDFSTDYRSTALFWEMHVGGAALDGFLMMTLPFGVLALLRTRSPWRFAAALAVVLLAVYACLTTFSRGVYLALPLSLIPLVLLADAQRRRAASDSLVSSHLDSKLGVVEEPLPRTAKIGALLMAGAFTLSSVLVFSGGGYRGMLALFGVLVILLAMPASLWLPNFGQRLSALLLGGVLALALGGASWALSIAMPKAAYVLNAVALLCCGLLRRRDRPGAVQPVYLMAVTTCWFWLLFTMVVVADYWGGTSGRWTAMAAGLALAALWAAMLLLPKLWPLHRAGSSGWRKRALLAAGLVLVMGLVAVLGGGVYLRERMATWKEDGQVRITHWTDSLKLLHGAADWLVGKGSGRYVASNFYDGPEQHVGDYRVGQDGGRHFLALAAGLHEQSGGEQLRISQRIQAPAPGPARLRLIARSAANTQVVLQLCEKNLLYPDNCAGMEPMVLPQGAPQAGQMGQWQVIDQPLATLPRLGGHWWAPRFVTLSMSLNYRGARVDIASVELIDASGRSLLHNGDFSQDLSRWLFTSDRHHLPWHIKNVALHVLFEQGLLGLALTGAAYLLALGRLSFGHGRDHPLAPAVAAALIGFAVIGAFDSLLDAPRIGFVFFTLLLLGLGLRALPGEGVPRTA